ncbi:hypothetical protein ST44_05425 [Prevotella pectinovora]|uniref:Uncharacterized protein n=1 Tax=Prevotella pectinovora TaxID=1602169 RepID=A0A0D0IWK3_9BACT|nr:hypothetical protein ST43_06720 [Prevotella pectinovora]KIP62889.1 hypothetical protein ST44_05425 [Prevotella pectinovora]
MRIKKHSAEFVDNYNGWLSVFGFMGNGIMTVLLQAVVKYNIKRHNDRWGLKQSTQTSHQDRFGLNDVL